MLDIQRPHFHVQQRTDHNDDLHKTDGSDIDPCPCRIQCFDFPLDDSHKLKRSIKHNKFSFLGINYVLLEAYILTGAGFPSAWVTMTTGCTLSTPGSSCVVTTLTFSGDTVTVNSHGTTITLSAWLTKQWVSVEHFDTGFTELTSGAERRSKECDLRGGEKNKGRK